MGFTDWQEPMGKLFQIKTPATVVEFGLGEGTQWFLERCQLVFSIELVAHSDHVPWYKMMLEKYEDFENWQVVKYDVEDIYSRKIEGIINSYVKPDMYQLTFVDPGVHCRAKIVNQLFGKVPIIAAHDIERGHDKYEWTEITVPSDYHEYKYKNGEGVGFWFQDQELHRKFVEACQP